MAAAKKGHWKARIFAMILITAALGVSLLFEAEINRALGFVREEQTPTVTESIDLDVHFVDVGQGDACILELPDDRVMLIDAGERDSEDKLIQYIDENIRRDGEKLDGFDIVMLTHSDSDHCGEMADVLEQYPAEVFYRPNVAATRDGYTDPGIAAGDLYGSYESKDTMQYRDAIEAGYATAGTTYATDATDDEQNVIRPEGISEGEPGYYTLTLYTPTVDSYSDANNYSPIMILEYEGKRFALSGDAEKEAEAEFVALAKERRGKILGVRRLVLRGRDQARAPRQPHFDERGLSRRHHDAVGLSVDFRDRLLRQGQFVRHPHAETLERLHTFGFTDDHILRTDMSGSIVATVSLDEDGMYALTVGGVVAPAPETFQWRWLYVAGILFAAAFVLIIILPSLTKSGRKKVVREAADSIRDNKGRKRK